ncbi:hypothetical protein ACB098_08G174400 [Castanea mollissima]
MNPYQYFEQKPPKSHKNPPFQFTKFTMNPYQHFEQKTPKSYPFQFTKFTMNPYQHLTQKSTKSHKKPISINKIPNPTFTIMKPKITVIDTHLFVHISLPSHDSSKEQPGNLIEFGGLNFGGPNPQK